MLSYAHEHNITLRATRGRSLILHIILLVISLLAQIV